MERINMTQVPAFSNLKKLKKGARMSIGICGYVASMIETFVSSRVSIIDPYGDIVDPESSVRSVTSCYFKPVGWSHSFDHDFQMYACTDGKVAIDVPMKEYSFHDEANFYWSGNQDIHLYLASTSRELMEMWEITKEEAVRMAKEFASWDIKSLNRIDLSKRELYCRLAGIEYANPNQLSLF